MISFVYFDVGGVVAKDFSNSTKWQDLQAELGIDPQSSDAFSKLFRDRERDICTSLPIEKLLPTLEREFGAKIPDDYPLLESFLKRFERNDSIWPVAKKVKEYAKVGLLTNMYVGMLDGLMEREVIPDVKWDVIIDSSICERIKPDKEIFDLAEKRAGVKGNEILFVDNNKSIVAAAAEYGLQTYWYDSGDYEGSSKKLLDFFGKHH